MTVFEATKELIGILMGMRCAYDAHIEYASSVNMSTTRIKTVVNGGRREVRMRECLDGKLAIALHIENGTHPSFSALADDTSLPGVSEWLAGKRNLTL